MYCSRLQSHTYFREVPSAVCKKHLYVFDVKHSLGTTDIYNDRSRSLSIRSVQWYLSKIENNWLTDHQFRTLYYYFIYIWIKFLFGYWWATWKDVLFIDRYISILSCKLGLTLSGLFFYAVLWYLELKKMDGQTTWSSYQPLKCLQHQFKTLLASQLQIYVI